MRAVSVSLLLAFACGNSASAGFDADTGEDASRIDASIPDAAPPDAFNPCPAATTFEVGAVDWTTGDNLPGVSVREGETGNLATSAPNGRIVLCLSGSGPLNIHFGKANYVDRVHTTTVEAIAAQYASGQAPSFRMITTVDADALYTGAAATRSAVATTFIAMPTDATTGRPLAGATVAIAAANEGAYTPDGAGIVSGAESQADGKVIFLNAALGAGSTEVNVTGPTSCEIPASVTLGVGVSSVAIACQP